MYSITKVYVLHCREGLNQFDAIQSIVSLRACKVVVWIKATYPRLKVYLGPVLLYSRAYERLFSLGLYYLVDSRR